MTISLRESLAAGIMGPSARSLDWDGVAKYLRENYLKSDKEQERRKMHKRRQELYRDAGLKYIYQLIDATFADQSVRDMRKAWAKTARFNNVLKRIVNELSTVYQEPAARVVGGAKKNQETYDEIQRLARQHEKSRQLNRLANLHRAIDVGFRVRNVGSVAAPKLQPVIDLVTPDEEYLVTNPNDRTHILARIIEIDPRPAREMTAKPKYLVWSDAERFHMDGEFGIIASTIRENPFGRMPYVFLTLEPPGDDIWPGEAGEDLVAAHMAIWFASVCLLKETKSATKLTNISGDMTAMARQQAADTELPVETPDGVSLTTLDMSMDLAIFRDTANHILDATASNYGLSPAILRHQGVQSAEARDLMRVPLRELRLEQHEPLREFERDFVEVQAAVLGEDMPELAFDPKGWRIDFADPQTPRSPKEQLEEFEHARRLGLDSAIRLLLRNNPDLEEGDAKKLILQFVNDELWRQLAQRPLMQINGGMNQSLDDARTPEQNGQAGQRQDDTADAETAAEEETT